MIFIRGFSLSDSNWDDKKVTVRENGSRHLLCYGGTSEIQQLVIARAISGLRIE